MSTHFYNQLTKATRLLCTNYGTVDHRVHCAVSQHLRPVMSTSDVPPPFETRRKRIIAVVTMDGETRREHGEMAYNALLNEDGPSASDAAEEIWRLHRDVQEYRSSKQDFPDDEVSEEVALLQVLPNG